MPHAHLETWSQRLDLRQLAEQWGTPTYLLYAPQLRERVQAYTSLVGDTARILFPVKTNPSQAVLRRLADLGCGMDCASRDEVELAQLAGVPLERISYNTPAPEFGLIRTLLRAGATVVVDSEELLERINSRLKSEQVQGELFLRLNIDLEGSYRQHFKWEDLVHHGSSTSKFGIAAERVVDLLSDLPLPISGLHVHVGTMMDNLEVFASLLPLLHGLVDAIAERTPHRISKLNLGGGLGIPFLPGQIYPTVEELVASLVPLKRPNLHYFVEPGQSLVGEAVGLLSRLQALKTLRGRRWGILDVGSDQLIKITTVAWYHQILSADHSPLPLKGPDALGGPLCFAGDTILPNTSLDGLDSGDVLLIQHAGAYLEAIANRFNGRRSVGMVVLDGEGSQRATTPEDPFLAPPLQTYDWAETPLPWRSASALSSEEIAALQSSYLRDGALEDRYTFVAFQQVGTCQFIFTVTTAAVVDFVSVPFALRIAADAVIISVLRSFGKQLKDIDVWSPKGAYHYGEPIAPGRELEGRISLSPVARTTDGSMRLMSRTDLDQGRFQLTAEVAI